MEYRKTIRLRDGRACCLRNGTEQDGPAVLENFLLTHAQTDYLLSYPDECTMTAAQEAQFLKEKTESPDEIELLAEVEGRVVGTAGIGRVGAAFKVRHRAEFGVSIDRACWGLGIGRALDVTGLFRANSAAPAEQIHNQQPFTFFKSVCQKNDCFAHVLLLFYSTYCF